jgi:hypothetical protein
VFAVLAAGVTTVAVLGGLGALPSSAQWQAQGVGASADALQQVAFDQVTADDGAQDATGGVGVTEGSTRRQADEVVADEVADQRADETLPADSGQGRRVVFSESRQRVWLVSGRQNVKRTYLVSGSVYDNLDPGTYDVYSRSERAWGIDDSGSMKWFVRFARGERAAIGFHDIPVADGRPVQTVAQLGTAQSHGCIRQRPADARALWRFAPLGTTVVVTA